MKLANLLNQKNTEIVEEVLRLMGVVFDANQMTMPQVPEDDGDAVDPQLDELIEALSKFIVNTNDNTLTLEEFAQAAPLMLQGNKLVLRQMIARQQNEIAREYWQHPQQNNLILERTSAIDLTQGLVCVQDENTGNEIHYEYEGQ